MRLANRPVSSRTRDRRSRRRLPVGGLEALVKSLQELQLAKQREHLKASDRGGIRGDQQGVRSQVKSQACCEQR